MTATHKLAKCTTHTKPCMAASQIETKQKKKNKKICVRNDEKLWSDEVFKSTNCQTSFIAHVLSFLVRDSFVPLRICDFFFFSSSYIFISRTDPILHFDLFEPHNKVFDSHTVNRSSYKYGVYAYLAACRCYTNVVMRIHLATTSATVIHCVRPRLVQDISSWI